VELLIDKSGNCRCVYGEAIDVHTLGRVHIQRGSHVEPTAGGQWIADLSPVDGPRLGPFGHRSEALEAELRWLSKNWLAGPAFNASPAN
jgi:hypothetical protein